MIVSSGSTCSSIAAAAVTILNVEPGSYEYWRAKLRESLGVGQRVTCSDRMLGIGRHRQDLAVRGTITTTAPPSAGDVRALRLRARVLRTCWSVLVDA
jgi:hypothetical protein